MYKETEGETIKHYKEDKVSIDRFLKLKETLKDGSHFKDPEFPPE